jgi:hypothetical protein
MTHVRGFGRGYAPRDSSSPPGTALPSGPRLCAVYAEGVRWRVLDAPDATTSITPLGPPRSEGPRRGKGAAPHHNQRCCNTVSPRTTTSDSSDA